MDAILAGIPAVTSMITGVFDLITSNALLSTFVAIGLLGSVVGLFTTLRGAAQ